MITISRIEKLLKERQLNEKLYEQTFQSEVVTELQNPTVAQAKK